MTVTILQGDVRDATLIELNQEYVAMARRRIEADAPLLADIA